MLNQWFLSSVTSDLFYQYSTKNKQHTHTQKTLRPFIHALISS